VNGADVVPFPSQPPMQRVDLMQCLESSQAEDVAEFLAGRVHGESITDLTAKERAVCRFVAVHAVRSLHEHWTDAAQHKAQSAAHGWMRTEGGKAFRELSDVHLRHLAVHLVSVVLCAYHGITEGTTAIPPGEYLEIVSGGNR
jgi:hypothetical protein